MLAKGLCFISLRVWMERLECNEMLWENAQASSKPKYFYYVFIFLIICTLSSNSSLSIFLSSPNLAFYAKCKPLSIYILPSKHSPLVSQPLRETTPTIPMSLGNTRREASEDGLTDFTRKGSWRLERVTFWPHDGLALLWYQKSTVDQGLSYRILALLHDVT